MKPVEDIKAEAVAVGLRFIGPYLGIMKPTDYECPTHGVIRQVPNKVQQKIGCQKCGRQRQHDSRRTAIDDVIESARSVGLEYLSGYVNTSTPALYRCPVHGEIKMSHSVVHRGGTCRKCAALSRWDGRRKPKVQKILKRPPVTDERCQQEASAVGLLFVGPYKGMHGKTGYQCSVHGLIEMEPNSVRRGAGCKICSGNVSKERDVLDQEAAAIGLRFIGPYHGDNRLTAYECPSHGEIRKRPGSIHGGHGCAKCAKYGFTPSKPADFYVYRMTGMTGGASIGFGITGDFETRDKAHRRAFSRAGVIGELIAKRSFELGRDAAELEWGVKSGGAFPIRNTGIPGFVCEAVDVASEQRLLEFVNTWDPGSNRPI